MEDFPHFVKTFIQQSSYSSIELINSEFSVQESEDMRVPSESFHIFREELRKEKLEKEKLRVEYEQRVSSLSEELSILKEQIDSQSDMIKRTIDYAIRLEQELDSFKSKVSEDQRNAKRSYH